LSAWDSMAECSLANLKSALGSAMEPLLTTPKENYAPSIPTRAPFHP